MLKTESSYHMDDISEIFKAFATKQGASGTMIACLYSGRFPEFCSPMVRDPAPPIGMELDARFFCHVTEAIATNHSVHDGAIMLGRQDSNSNYVITGWSFRLFAPESTIAAPANRGSAFNSCLAMAQVTDVDRIYLHSSGKMYLFKKSGFRVL
ncbi:hypothetical protein [Rhizobium mesosinicum]|uniref:Uncharacterized protein n=1 Tax=Rhizobium mesosinicum TaxID=335017 RepID=A0ABS7GQN7_9HYPH|nr:hypothetical protein [Rhizobium mesosinicum]MBW9052266.1 hypothetical protein [Rhizobium mesosinicum]